MLNEEALEHLPLNEYLDEVILRMTPQRQKDIYEDAHLVRFTKDTRFVYVWYGGTTVNKYNTITGKEVNVFTRSDERGEPLDYSAIMNSIVEDMES